MLITKIVIVVVALVAAYLVLTSPVLTGQVISAPGTADEGAVMDIARFLESMNASAGNDGIRACMWLAQSMKSNGFDAAVAVNPETEESWVVVRTEGGRVNVDAAEREIIDTEDNPGYVEGFMLEDIEDVGTYMSMYNALENARDRHGSSLAAYHQCLVDWESLSDGYDAAYGGRAITDESEKARAAVYEKHGECEAYRSIVDSDNRDLDYYNKSIASHLNARGIEL